MSVLKDGRIIPAPPKVDAIHLKLVCTLSLVSFFIYRWEMMYRNQTLHWTILLKFVVNHVCISLSF